MTTKQWIAVVTLIAAGAAASVAQAHAKIESSQPKADSELQSAPKEIRLRFNEALEPAFSKIELFDANNVQVGLPKPELDKTSHKVLFAALPALQPGQYRVRWSTMALDGHKAKGQFVFRVK